MKRVHAIRRGPDQWDVLIWAGAEALDVFKALREVRASAYGTVRVLQYVHAHEGDQELLLSFALSDPSVWRSPDVHVAAALLLIMDRQVRTSAAKYGLDLVPRPAP